MRVSMLASVATIGGVIGDLNAPLGSREATTVPRPRRDQDVIYSGMISSRNRSSNVSRLRISFAWSSSISTSAARVLLL